MPNALEKTVTEDIFRQAKELDYWRGDEEAEWDSLVSLKLLTRNTKLVEARKAKGITQVQMAKDIGMAQLRLSHIENLKFIPPDADKAKIAAYLVQSIDYLFPDILMKAIEEGVFSHRDAQLAEPEIISLTEAQRLRLTYDGEGELINQVDRKLLEENLNKILGELKPVEQAVLEARFGFYGHSLTLEETAERLSWRFWNRKPTREWIRAIEAKALRKLRHPSMSRMLKDYLE